MKLAFAHVTMVLLSLALRCDGEVRFDEDSGVLMKVPPGCTSDKECQPTAPRCHAASGTCVVCLVDQDCAGTAAHPFCDAVHGRCVACTADPQCPVDLPRCDQAQGACVKCLTSSDCANHHSCSPTNTCVDADDLPRDAANQ